MITPLQAIRAHCRWCCLEQPYEISMCQSMNSCRVWPFRLGRLPEISALLTIVDYSRTNPALSTIFDPARSKYYCRTPPTSPTWTMHGMRLSTGAQ
jgi:hypothetical protein